MNNPLTSLDELIWQQFEKVTQYTHKEYGWDKYDCKQITDSLSGVAALGVGIYGYISGFILKEYLAFIPFGTLFSAAGISLPYLWKKENEISRTREINEIIQRGVARQPFYTWMRPLAIAAGVGAVSAGINFLISDGIENHVKGLITIPGTAYCELLLASSYFSSQIMAPPCTKKSFWKTAYEGIKNKFNPKPQLEPAAVPSSHYSLTDHLDATNF